MKRFLLVVAVVTFVPLVSAQESTSTSNAPTPALSPVTWERLLNAAEEPENWLMYSGTLDSQRHSRLD